MAGTAKPRILVLGGGFAGLEAAFYMRMRLPDEADITLVSEKDYFLFKPNTIYIPFGLDPDKLKVRLDKPTRQKNISFITARVHDLDPEARFAHVDGMKIPYDYLFIATGAGIRPTEIPGLAEHANSIWTVEEMLRLRAAFRRLRERAKDGTRQRVLFLIPPNNKFSGPLYEIALMLDTWLRRKGSRNKVSLSWSTCEKSYVQAFGPRLHEVVAEEFQERGILGYTGFTVEGVEKDKVVYTEGEHLPYDLLVTFPPHVASTPYAGLPSDERGFIQTDLATRQVTQRPEIYATGDASDFPVKQAFLAYLQADAAAEHLSAQVLGTEPEFSFNPLSLSVMEQLDKATFAQVPLRATGIADGPVEVHAEAGNLYKVGSSPVWRLGKKLLGVYLPWRFDAGNPFCSGLSWKGMELGLKAASKMLAD